MIDEVLEKNLSDAVANFIDAHYRYQHQNYPKNLNVILLDVVQKSMFDVVMKRTRNNQSKASLHLGLNRNTVRKHLLRHTMLEKYNGVEI